MANSLIKTILLQANNPNTKLADLPDLKKQLKSDSTGSILTFFALVGGLGADDYKKVKSSLVIDKKEIITAIDEKSMMQCGLDFLQQAKKSNDKKMAYRAGLCFALVAVYADEFSRKLEAYKQLADLCKEKVYLNDIDVLNRVNEFLAPLSLTGDYYHPTRKILWSWELKGKSGILDFETQRQDRILDNYPTFSIKNSLLLLGLTDEDLNKEKVNTAATACRTRLKEIAGLTAQEKSSNTLMRNFTTAEQTLSAYLNFCDFNYKERFKALDKLLDKAPAADICEQILFNDINTCFRDLNKEIETIVKRASAEEDPYITDLTIQRALGLFVSCPTQYAAQKILQDKATVYWDTMSDKVDNLLSSTQKFMSSMATSKTIDLIKDRQNQLGVALSVLSVIKGSALEETSPLVTAAKNIEEIIRTIRVRIDVLKKKIEQYEGAITMRVNRIVVLEQSAIKESTASILEAVDINRAISDRQTMISQIADDLSWLENLDKKSREFSDAAFKTYLVSQPTLDEVVDGVAKVLGTLSKPFRDEVLTSYLGRNRYNPRVELKNTIRKFFDPSKKQDIKQIAITLMGDLKTIMADLSERFPEYKTIKDGISVTKIIPESVYMTFDLAKQSLEESKNKLDKSVKQAISTLNEDLQKMVAPLLTRYDAAFHYVRQIMQEKNSLTFSWQRMMAELVQQQEGLQKDFITLSAKIPADLNKAPYIESSLRILIQIVQKRSAEYKQKTDKMTEDLGKISLDALKYLLLKNLIRKERNVYQAQGSHHQARKESLERLCMVIEQIDGFNLGNRLVSLQKAVQEEKDKTRTSQEQIGFLGHYRSSRLEKIYAKVIDVSEHLTRLVPTESWADVSLDLDALKYIMLKAHVQQEIKWYTAQGKHHQDRQDSLGRLMQKIEELDKHEDNTTSRFATLVTVIQEEETATLNSQLKVGFFGSWRTCRLQNMYAKILTGAVGMNAIGCEVTEELTHDDDSSNTLDI